MNIDIFIIKSMQSTSYQKVIQRIKEHGASYKLQEVCLDEIKLVLFTQQISLLLQKCQKIEHLSLCHCQLSSLIHFPTLPALSQLQLSYNNLEGQYLEPLSKCNRLYSLSLDSNLIKDFSWTKYLKRTRLAQITLQGNPIAKQIQYREKIYKGLGADLQLIDNIDRQGNYVDLQSSSQDDQEQQEEGQGHESEQRENNSHSEENEDSLQKKMKLEENSQRK